MTVLTRRPALAWALYDWGNSAFATTVLAGFFPVFFKRYWASGMTPTESTWWLGLATAGASLAVAVTAPLAGAVADGAGWRKPFLLAAAGAGIAATLALPLVAAGAWAAAAALYLLATVGWSGANVFYDSLVVAVAPENKLDVVSAFGYALGYLGGGLLFALHVLMVRSPESFGLADASAAIRVAFVTVGVWWALFAVPLFRWVPEPAGPRVRAARALGEGLRRLLATARSARRLKPVFLFLVAYWLYIDGVDTVIRMAVDYGLALGFPETSLVTALLVTQLVGFPAALVYGKLGERYGTRRGIAVGIAVYVAVTFWGWRMDSVWEFYALAAAVGLVQGGLQALSRSFFARIIPLDQTAEFFGLYNMLGKFAAVIGPVLVGQVALVTGSSRAGILSVVVLFVAGGALLLRVDESEARAAAGRTPLAG